MNLIFQPLTQAMANAHSHGDIDWVSRGYRKSLRLVSGIGLLAIVLGGTIGPWVMRVWLGHGVELSHLSGAIFGFYFLILCLSLLHFYVLSAIGGLPGIGKVYLFQGVIALSLGAMLCVWYGAVGMATGLSLGLAATAWVLPFAVRRELKAMRALGVVADNGSGSHV
jgi:O-antigen/teichoic acid export membrane protein